MFFVLLHSVLHIVLLCQESKVLLLFFNSQNEFGLFAPFLFFSVICVLNIIFTAVFVPETNGRTLEEMEAYFRT